MPPALPFLSPRTLFLSALRIIRSKRRFLAVSLCQLLLIIYASPPAQSSKGAGARPEKRENAVSATSHGTKKRIAPLRRSETQEGTRFTLTSDSLLGDYSSYVEGERFFVKIPQAALSGAQKKGGSGRGFTDLRVEQRDDDVVLSFILQIGASVSFNQTFNRLDVVFITNEQAYKAGALASHARGRAWARFQTSLNRFEAACGPRDIRGWLTVC
ncbi:MAG TPA: hypothetical protein VF791_03715 [Pyrinomonadaceae bacterium]